MVAGRQPHRVRGRPRRRLRSDVAAGQGRSASRGDVHARRRAVAVVDARWPTGFRASRRRSGRPAGRSVAAVGSLRDRAGRRVRNLAGAASPDRNHRQRNVATRLARWPARRLRLRSRFDRRRGSVGDAGAGGIVAKPVPLGARPPQPRPAADAAARSDIQAVESRPPRVVRVTRVRGDERAPSWAPDSQRVAFYAVRDGVGSVWVASVEPPSREPNDKESIARPRPAAPPALVSRLGGAPAWSPDGRTLLVAGLARAAAGLQRQPAAQFDRAAAALFVVARVSVVAGRGAGAGARRRRRAHDRARAVAGAA